MDRFVYLDINSQIDFVKKLLVFILLLSPAFVLSQSLDEKYAIYSSYLRSVDKKYEENRKVNCTFVVRISSKDELIDNRESIAEIAKTWRGYLNGDKGSASDLLFEFRSSMGIINDTLFLPLIEKLRDGLSKSQPLKSRFASDLHVFMLTYSEYSRYIDGHNFDWEVFHQTYSRYSELVDFSNVFSDGKRALFYCSRRYNPLGGVGELVFYYRDQNGWHLSGIVNLWNA